MSVRTMRIGDRFTTNEGYVVEVVDYKNSKAVTVRFIDQDVPQRITCVSAIYKGQIKNPLHRSVCGVGYIGVGVHKSKVNGKVSPAHKKWMAVLDRCYGQKYGASVCDEWHNFQNFAEWYYNYHYKADDWELDKDVLSEHSNKVYSPDTCCFIPRQLNMLMVHDARRAEDENFGIKLLPSGKYAAIMKRYNKNFYIGTYLTIGEARTAYSIARKGYVSDVVNIWKDVIDPRVVERLLKIGAFPIVP